MRFRWVLFPPEVPKEIVKGKGLRSKGEDDEAIHYFDYILPRIKEKNGASIPCILECVQAAGETIFVPGNWWHAVLNLDNTVAIT